MEHLGSFISIAVIVVCVGLIVWRRKRQQARIVIASPAGLSQKELAHHAFTQGNTYLMQGDFAKATAAFQQVLELEPKHPHVGGRIAEVARRQQAEGTVASVSSTL